MSSETTKTHTKIIDGSGTETLSTEALMGIIQKVREKIEQIICQLEDIRDSIDSSLGWKYEH